jgi:hypothetical protein
MITMQVSTSLLHDVACCTTDCCICMIWVQYSVVVSRTISDMGICDILCPLWRSLDPLKFAKLYRTTLVQVDSATEVSDRDANLCGFVVTLTHLIFAFCPCSKAEKWPLIHPVKYR